MSMAVVKGGSFHIEVSGIEQLGILCQKIFAGGHNF